jgi:WhiB family transcriptional regulator, redox-sensing transcriptional regulator
MAQMGGLPPRGYRAILPDRPGSRAMAETQQAKAICARCQVRQPCLACALATGQAHGIWGGYDEEERRVLHRQRRESAGGNPAGHETG